MTGLSTDEIANIEWHCGVFTEEVSDVLSRKAFDIVGWMDDPAMLLRKPSGAELAKRREMGVRFWLTRLALAKSVGLDDEARTSAAQARTWGARWADVGAAVKMSRQGAQQRFGG